MILCAMIKKNLFNMIILGFFCSWLQESQNFKLKQAEEILNQKSKKKTSAHVENNAYKVNLGKLALNHTF